MADEPSVAQPAPPAPRVPGRSSAALVVGCLLFAFLLVTAARSRPADPESRLPRQFRLAGLIQRQQRSTAALRSEVDESRARLERTRRAVAGQRAGAEEIESRLERSRTLAGLVAVRGPGLEVTLDDSSLTEPETENVNDLVIHSEDVQAVVNAAWRSGAEAVSINGQRLVSTSAVLCVGNTLLLNGTVHSPPYVVRAVGASRERFEADALVERLHDDADAFGLRFSVDRESALTVAAYDGTVRVENARPPAA